MQWRQGSKYHLESDNGRFSIAKVFVGGKAIYELWMSDRGRWRRVDTLKTAAEAKSAAELEDVF